MIRDGFEGYEEFIDDENSFCFYSGAPTDIRLPDGEYIWAPYFLSAVKAGIIKPDSLYSREAFRAFLRSPNNTK